MSDLISRKKVIDILEKEKSLRCSYDADITIFSIEKGIRELPTAYSVDKVIKELKNIKSRYFLTLANSGDKFTDFAYEKVGNALDEAIEIVKQDNVSDDVCEWKFEETNGIAWHCDDKCTTYNRVYIKDLKITLEDFECKCPYCSKKIKVVE